MILVGCSHGTADPDGRATILAILARIAEARPELDVREAFVDVQQPEVADVVRRAVEEGGADDGAPVVVVPLLLSAGYHVHVDIAAAVEPWGARAVAAPALGPDPRLVELLDERLDQAGALPDDAVVLAAAGSSDERATADVERVAAELARRRRGPVTVGYGSAAYPRVPAAVDAARASGARRVAIASYLLAPGFFHDRLQLAGADTVSRPLGADARVVGTALDRWAEAVRPVLVHDLV
ncbi:sirohydrochlorin chelatase [Cellulomonas sp. APG4]|uniref:sirohydrochlorin chelatase n=1 Tax=Cellulomonas sp. APG4 TaxID=1538656 RepID=UPI00351ABA98